MNRIVVVQECDPSTSFPIKSGRTQLPISEENDERSVATGDDSSNAVGNIK